MFKVEELLKATQGKFVSGKRDACVKGVSIDSRTLKRGEAFIAIKGRNYDGHCFVNEAIKKGSNVIIFKKPFLRTKPKDEITFIEVKDTVRALGGIARFHRQRFDIPVIAVTGSNGKTTTKEMIFWVLSRKFKVLKTSGTKNNQIGLPLTLLGLNNACDLAVLEIGSNHFGEIGYLCRICQPDIGVITNIGPSHLEYFKNLEGVFREKMALIRELKKPGLAILNADDRFLKKVLHRAHKRPLALGFGIKNRSDFLATEIRALGQSLQFSVNQKYRFTLRTLGYYNIHNALAAVACARIFGMSMPDAASRLATFVPPQNRLQLLTLNNITFIDDTYNSNPLSLRQSLAVLKDSRAEGRKIFVMGDMLELGRRAVHFHRQIGKEAARICDVFIAVGPLSKWAALAARKEGLKAQDVFLCENNLEARDILYKKVNPGSEDLVLIKGSRAMMLEKILQMRQYS
ncbi:MAG: UDP-N-acetylmuramoyl-tripeptide--D-alanyl-D-alanine ligase [Candidatus Omnitrophota bacterium]